MPNYVYNTIKCSHEDLEKIRELVKTDKCEFDFNEIIRMPRTLDIIAGSSTRVAEQYLKGELDISSYPDGDPEVPWDDFIGTQKAPKTRQELECFAEIVDFNKNTYGFTDWYGWRNWNWGTKWNACDVYWEGNSVHFDTAWSSPDPILIKLSEMLGIRFTVESEEESLAFCCRTVFDSGVIEDEEGAEGVAGMKLLGYPKDEVIARYEWLEKDDPIWKEIDKVYGEEEL